jgi:hypothetical protein
VGDINTYQVFAGLVRQIVGPAGRVGVVIPSGIATDYFNQDYFSTIVEEQELVSIYDFENKRGLFPEIGAVMKFCLLTLSGTESPIQEPEFAFFLWEVSDLTDLERRYTLTKDDFSLLNPNTKTCPVFRTRRDAESTKKLYRAAPVLVNEDAGKNPWGVSFLRMFDMTNDSHLFHTREELEAQGFTSEGNRFVREEKTYLPLYEAKLFNQYDHRQNTFEGIPEKSRFVMKAGTNEFSSDDKSNPSTVVIPRYWTSQESVIEQVGETSARWFIGFRNAVQMMTNARCAMFTILPFSGVGNSAPLIFLRKAGITEQCALLANFNSFCFDYATRQSIGGGNLNFYIIKQLPVLPPDCYTPDLLDFIVPRVVELTYTAWDLQPFAQDILDEVGEETWARWFADAPVHDSPPPSWAAGETPAPFIWDEQRRAALRAELDAVYAHLYGLTRDELAYILDTFPIVKRKDEAQYGEYRTKRMILERYEEVGPLTR